MRKYPFVPIVLTFALGLAIAARAEETKEQEKKEIPSQKVGGIADVADAGTLSGIVLFTGTKPETKPLSEIAGNSFCKEHHKDELPRKDTFSFGKNGDRDTLRNVLIYVSKGLEDQKFDPPEKPAVLDQVGCMYTPHVVAVMAGQTLEVRNSDATLHNVMASPRDNPAFNFGMSVQGSTHELVFKGPELKINTKCFMHPWMSAYIHVLEHPFFAVTGEDGTFTLHGLPPGEYEISVLHESAVLEPTPATETVTIAAGETKDLEFTYKLRSEE